MVQIFALNSFKLILLCMFEAELLLSVLSYYVVIYFFLTSVRVFLRQLVLSCPPEYYESLLCPLLGPLFAYMQQVRLTILPLLLHSLYY